jgi:hypothetical protein
LKSEIKAGFNLCGSDGKARIIVSDLFLRSCFSQPREIIIEKMIVIMIMRHDGQSLPFTMYLKVCPEP